MDSQSYDTWIDELDFRRLDEDGLFVLRRKYIKNENYIEPYSTHPERAPIVANGITAFLFSNSYFGGIQLMPLTFSETKNNIDIKEYYKHYFLIRKKFTLQKEKAKPDSVHRNIEKDFLLNHIKQEKKSLKKLEDYLETIADKHERKIRKQYVISYIKWIKNKKNPLRTIHYVELFAWVILCLLIVFLLALEFFWTDSDWNFVQNINKEYTRRDSLSQQILVSLIVFFGGVSVTGILRIKKFLKFITGNSPPRCS
ncbi:hypothetical protein [Cyclobacterium marinum]|uniref:hypothetical protein n=1 Tax=Cyclobacterium marinum TaxID=104 RepID=UPI0011EC33E6|nr:hypothetical protein [Cyclobacterium marinum]MBI0401135.1 hypothetical protein [Cyclobacterium marinum]